MPNFKIDTYLKIILFISLFSIISAFFIEFILGHQPCNLCLIQRVPYGLSIILIFLIFYKKKCSIYNSIINPNIFFFFHNIILPLWNRTRFLEESAVCGVKDASDIISKEELLKQLQEKTVSCKDVTFKIFGFSLATINIFISLILVFLLIKIFNNYEKYKK